MLLKLTKLWDENSVPSGTIQRETLILLNLTGIFEISPDDAQGSEIWTPNGRWSVKETPEEIGNMLDHKRELPTYVYSKEQS